MADCKRYNGSTWEYSLRKLATDTDTITTLPADIYPTGTTATVGLKGNKEHTGTPTPDNPIMPQGTGERTGNLFDINTVGIENGTFNPSTGATSPNDKRCRTTNFISLGLGTYTLATNPSIRYVLYVYDTNENYIQAESITAWVSDTLTFTLNNDRKIKFGFSKVNDPVITPSEVQNIMLNLGSTPLPYEPYGYFIEIEVS